MTGTALRLLLTVLGTAWCSGVAVAWIVIPTWVGFDAGNGGAVGWWLFGWLPFLILGAVPFGIWAASAPQEPKG